MIFKAFWSDNKQIITKRNSFVAAICIVVLLSTIWLMHGNNRRSCSTVMAFIPPTNNPIDKVSLYSEKYGLHPVLDISNPGIMLGYDESSGAWVFLGMLPGGSLRLADKGKTCEVRLQGLPANAALISAKLCGGKVFIPCIQNDTLALYIFTLDGKLFCKRILRVPKTRIGDFDDRIMMDVAPNGYVAASLMRLTTKNTSQDYMNDGEWNLYLFDEQNRMIKKMGDIAARFSWDAKSIAYIDPTESNPKTELIILDLHTGKRKSVELLPKGTGILERILADGIGEWKWDSRNQWLFVTYTGGSLSYGYVHAVDISTDKPRWYKLPISTNINWYILDRYPNQVGK